MGDEMDKEKQKIKCDVYDCEYCNCDCNRCSLAEIKVSKNNENNSKDDTKCDSYKKRK